MNGIIADRIHTDQMDTDRMNTDRMRSDRMFGDTMTTKMGTEMDIEWNHERENDVDLDLPFDHRFGTKSESVHGQIGEIVMSTVRDLINDIVDREDAAELKVIVKLTEMMMNGKIRGKLDENLKRKCFVLIYRKSSTQKIWRI